MTIRTYIQAYIHVERQFKSTKFSYEYQFVSYRNKMRLRGLDVLAFIKSYPSAAKKEWTSVLVLYPGWINCYIGKKLHDYSGAIILQSDVPDDIKKLTKRDQIKLPEDVKKALEKKTGAKLDKELSKT